MRLPYKALSTTIRHYCSKSDRRVAKSVFFSNSTDIFTNLALEDWLYKNRHFENHHLLMLWRNEPCVVIGRHQNPWLECNFAILPDMEKGVKLARRNSGGGTVYHDLQNLNLTFFTSREDYNRKRNLEVISRALNKSFNIHSEINKREDLCIEDCKISGTASKLGRSNAYHHCTLLVDADKKNISLALKNIIGSNVQTNASISVRSEIMNLSEVCPSITVEKVIEAIVLEYNKNSGVENVECVNDEYFPGVGEIKDIFLSDEWRFEKTPKFTIFRDLFSEDGTDVFLTVDKGKVSDAGIRYNKDKTISIINANLAELSGLFSGLFQKSFNKGVLDEFEVIVCGLRNSEKCRTIVLK